MEVESRPRESCSEQHIFDILAPINAGGMMHCDGILTDAVETDPFWGTVVMRLASSFRDPRLASLALIRARAIEELANKQTLSYITQALVEMRRSLLSKTKHNGAALIVVLLASRGYTLTPVSMPGASTSEIKHLWTTIDTICLRTDQEASLLGKWVGGRTSQGYYEAVEKSKASSTSAAPTKPDITDEERLAGRMTCIRPVSYDYYYDDVLRAALSAYTKTKFS